MIPIHNVQDPLDAIFTKALRSTKIVKENQALRSDYIPENLPFRNEQISSIGQILAPILHSSKPSNLLVYGKTGTGKTAVTRYVTSKLIHMCNSKKIPARFIYCNTRMTGTEYRTLAEFATGLGTKIPFTGLALSEVLSRLQTAMKKQEPLYTVLIMDELDYLVKSYGDNLLYHLTSSSDKISPSFLSIIGISNDLQFKEELGSRVQSRLSEEELVFPPYSVNELTSILSQRAELALQPNSYTNAAINLCAALSGAEHGDARRAVDLLRIAAEVAEREGAGCLDERHIRIALQKIDQDRITEALYTLPFHAKLVLLASVTLSEENPGRCSSGTVYEKYIALCKTTGAEPLTTRRVSSLLTELNTLGLLSAALVNYGRFGRTKKIIPQVPSSTVYQVFGQDESIKELTRKLRG
jgi:cell division control protein 6